MRERIYVYELDHFDIQEDLMNKISQRKQKCYFDSMRNNRSISFIKKLKFDNHQTVLIGFGKTDFFTLDLEEGIADTYAICEGGYEYIVDINFITNKSGRQQCWIAAKVRKYN